MGEKSPRRGLTLLEGGLLLALLLAAGGFAAWKAGEPGRILASLQRDLRLPEPRARADAAAKILDRFARDGMGPAEVRKLFEPLPLDERQSDNRYSLLSKGLGDGWFLQLAFLNGRLDAKNSFVETQTIK